jgi:hypothetical protein
MDTNSLSILATSNEFRVRPATITPSLTTYTSPWTSANSWGTGAAPGTSGRQCSNATTGSMPITSAVSEGSKLRIVRARLAPTGAAISYCVYDRLVDYSGYLANTTSSNAVTAVSLPRFTTGEGVTFFLEVYTTGASSVATTATVSYTNQAGVAGRTATVTLPGSWLTAIRAYSPVLQAGDTGVRSIQSVQLGASSPNAGNYGLTLFAPLAWLSSTRLVAGGSGSTFQDLATFTCNQFDTTAALAYWMICSSPSALAQEMAYSIV